MGNRILPSKFRRAMALRPSVIKEGQVWWLETGMELVITDTAAIETGIVRGCLLLHSQYGEKGDIKLLPENYRGFFKKARVAVRSTEIPIAVQDLGIYIWYVKTKDFRKIKKSMSKKQSGSNAYILSLTIRDRLQKFVERTWPLIDKKI